MTFERAVACAEDSYRLSIDTAFGGVREWEGRKRFPLLRASYLLRSRSTGLITTVNFWIACDLAWG